METLAELYKEYAVDGTRTVGIAHADCPDGALRLQAKLRDAGQTGEILSVCYEPVTGGHVGPGTVALFFFGEVCAKAGFSAPERLHPAQLLV